MHPHPLLEKLMPRNTEKARGRVSSIFKHIFTIGNNGGAFAASTPLPFGRKVKSRTYYIYNKNKKNASPYFKKASSNQ